MAYEDMQTGNYVSFQLHSNPILPNNYTRAKILSQPDRVDAMNYADVIALHAQLFSYIPGNPPRNADDLQYFKIQLDNGDVRVLAKDWINPATIELVDTKTYNFKIADLSPGRLNSLKTLLSANGFEAFDFSSAN